MAAIAGLGSSITFATGEVTNPKSYSLNVNRELLETTDQNSSGNREFIAGLVGGDGTITLNTDDTAPINETASGSATFTHTAGRTVAGTIFVNQTAITSDVQGLVEHTYSFNFSGAITIA